MSNENYVNHYIEILTATMSDAILRNVSLQANAKVTDEVLGQLQEENNLLRNQINDDSKLKQLEEEVRQLRIENGSLKSFQGDYQNVKSQANHVETFRNELAKARQEINDVTSSYESKIEQLNKQIEYLQLTPAKRKKLDEASKVVTPVVDVTEDTTTRDGGSF